MMLEMDGRELAYQSYCGVLDTLPASRSGGASRIGNITIGIYWHGNLKIMIEFLAN